MDTSTVPATKPQPVLIMGAVLAVMTALIASLTAIFNDNPSVMTVLAVVGAAVTAAGVGLTFLTRAQTVPFADVAAYVNDARALIPGPASNAIVTAGDTVAVVGLEGGVGGA